MDLGGMKKYPTYYTNVVLQWTTKHKQMYGKSVVLKIQWGRVGKCKISKKVLRVGDNEKKD